jgi:hypothetical protein
VVRRRFPRHVLGMQRDEPLRGPPADVSASGRAQQRWKESAHDTTLSSICSSFFIQATSYRSFCCILTETTISYMSASKEETMFIPPNKLASSVISTKRKDSPMPDDGRGASGKRQKPEGIDAKNDSVLKNTGTNTPDTSRYNEAQHNLRIPARRSPSGLIDACKSEENLIARFGQDFLRTTSPCSSSTMTNRSDICSRDRTFDLGNLKRIPMISVAPEPHVLWN